MSDYTKRYQVHNGSSSYYTDDPAEALRQYRRPSHGCGVCDGPLVYETTSDGHLWFKCLSCNHSHTSQDCCEERRWITEGYVTEEHIEPGHPDFGGIEGTLYTRHTTGRVLPSTLEFVVARGEVEALIREVD